MHKFAKRMSLRHVAAAERARFLRAKPEGERGRSTERSSASLGPSERCRRDFAKQICALTIITFLVVTLLPGCASVRKKFVRKKKKERKEFVVYNPVPQAGPNQPNAAMYDRHFVYWKTWQQELVDALERGNEKKLRAVAAEALSELKAMQRYLTEAHRPQLDPYIRELEGLVARITSRQPNAVEARELQVRVERHLVVVDKAFHTSRVQAWIQPDAETADQPVQ